jgi:putative methylase
MIYSKKQLAVTLSRLQNFEKPSFRLEQYPTDSEIAAEVLWFADQNKDIEGKIIADLGCGTGVLGIGAMFFSPEKVYFVDVDEKALKRLEENLALQDFDVEKEIILSNVKDFNKHADLVIQNPPFGVKSEHADRVFLETAFKISKVIYSFHKIESERFIQKISEDNGFKITHLFRFDFPLKNTMSFHEKRIERIKVGCWRLEKSL